MLPLLPTDHHATTHTTMQSAAAVVEGQDFERVLEQADCITGEHGGSYCELPEGVSGPDDVLANNSVTSLKMLAEYTKKSGSPFFLGVGFRTSSVLPMILYALMHY